jgi:hypothetical protein
LLPVPKTSNEEKRKFVIFKMMQGKITVQKEDKKFPSTVQKEKLQVCQPTINGLSLRKSTVH